MTTIIEFLKVGGSGTWTCPANFTNFVAIYCFGGGASGDPFGSGGGAGAFATKTSSFGTFTPLSTYSYSVGAGGVFGGGRGSGGNTWFNNTSFVKADGASSDAGASTGAGTAIYSGGYGGTNGGGGGAGGLNSSNTASAGKDGDYGGGGATGSGTAASGGSPSSQNGGNGPLGTGGGTSGSKNGVDGGGGWGGAGGGGHGGNYLKWTTTAPHTIESGGPGGGGGATTSSGTGGNGGTGAGGGKSPFSNSGNGGDGLIVLIYDVAGTTHVQPINVSSTSTMSVRKNAAKPSTRQLITTETVRRAVAKPSSRSVTTTETAQRTSAKIIRASFNQRNRLPNSRGDGFAPGTPGTPPAGWAVSAPSGVVVEAIGSGVEAGIEYFEYRFSGTPGSTGAIAVSFSPSTSVSARAGEEWTASFYDKLQAGSLTNVGSVLCTIWEAKSNGAANGNISTTIVPNGGALNTQRHSVTKLFSVLDTARMFMQLRINVTSGAAIDLTMRFGRPQAEIAPAPSAYAETPNAINMRLMPTNIDKLIDTPLVTGRRNFVLNSSDPTSPSWNKSNLSATAVAVDPPPGYSGVVAKCVPNTSNTSHFIDTSSISLSVVEVGQLWSSSVFLKAAELTTAYVYIYNFGGGAVATLNVDLLTGAIISSTGTGTPFAVDMGDGWWRVGVDGYAAVNGATLPRLRVLPNSASAWVGNNVDGIYVYGGQFEKSAATTPYLPSGATVGRDLLMLKSVAKRLNVSSTVLAFVNRLYDVLVNAYVTQQGPNLIPNSTMVGAVNGSPGTMPSGPPLGPSNGSWGTSTMQGMGITREILGTGVEDGLPYIDIRMFGTVTSLFERYVYPVQATAIPASQGDAFSFSLCVRRIGGSDAGLISTDTYVIFNNSSGSVLTATGSLGNPLPTIGALSGGQYSASGTAALAATAFVMPRFDFNMTVGATIDVTYRIGGAMLNRGLTLLDYAPSPATSMVTSIYRRAVNKLIRPSVGASVLIRRAISVTEYIASLAGARSNLLYDTNAIGNNPAAWALVRTTAPQNVVPAPPGYAGNAAKLVADTATNSHYVDSRSIPAAEVEDDAIFSASVYVKAAEYGFAYIQLIRKNGGATGSTVGVNLATGATYSLSGNARVLDAGNGWWRVCLDNIVAGPGGTAPRLRVTLQQTQGVNTFTGDGVSGIYVWGAQLEYALAASRYIPNSGLATLRELLIEKGVGKRITTTVLNDTVTVRRAVGKISARLATATITVRRAIAARRNVLATITELINKRVTRRPIVTTSITTARTIRNVGKRRVINVVDTLVTFGNFAFGKRINVSAPGVVTVRKSMPKRIAATLSGIVTLRRAQKKTVAVSAPTAVTSRKAVGMRRLAFLSPITATVNKTVPQRIVASLAGIVLLARVTAKRITASSTITQLLRRNAGKNIASPVLVTQTIRRGVFARVLRTVLTTITSTSWHVPGAQTFFRTVSIASHGAVVVTKNLPVLVRVASSIIARVVAYVYRPGSTSKGRTLDVQSRERELRVRRRFSFFSERNDF